ncbi:MAG: hypothetical protein LBV39_03845, partial [Bacteroidales bacterium]|nr:hypothetical protein [Bacteroidales bacterium]
MMEPDLILENRNGELTFKSNKLLSAIDEQIIKAVIHFQHDYFLTGDEALMKPMILNEAGQIATECWLQIPQHHPDAVLHECVIMPNHVHGIIELVGAN